MGVWLASSAAMRWHVPLLFLGRMDSHFGDWGVPSVSQGEIGVVSWWREIGMENMASFVLVDFVRVRSC